MPALNLLFTVICPWALLCIRAILLGVLAEFERKILREAIAFVQDARKPPQALQQILEPTWSVFLAANEVVHVREVQYPGDATDAVTRAWDKVKSRIQPDEVTLYLSIEPTSLYQRIAPVTEAIRKSQIKRIIVGTEDPFLRNKGKGIANLQRQGCSVLLADGEEARSCQLFYADYAKAMNQFLPQWTVAWELHPSSEAKVYNVQAVGNVQQIPGYFDVTCIEHQRQGNQKFGVFPRSLLLYLDPSGALQSSHPLFSVQELRLLYGANESAISRNDFSEKIERTLPLALNQERIDLGKVARSLRDLGLLSVITLEGIPLWSALVSAGISDRLLAKVCEPYNLNVSLVRLTESRLWLDPHDDSAQFRMRNPRLLQQGQDHFWVEAEIVRVTGAI